MPVIDTVLLPPGPDFFAGFARLLIGRHGDALRACDLVLPSFALAGRVRAALLAHAGTAVFMPRLLTEATLAARWSGDVDVDPRARRLLSLVDMLRRQGWLGNADLWTIARELLELSDELAEVDLPDEDELAALFARTHALSDCGALSLEARLVSAVWQSDRIGAPGHARARQLALLRAAASATRPLVVLLDRLAPVPRWVLSWGERAAVTVVRAQRPTQGTPLARALQAAWPVEGDEAPPLFLRQVAMGDMRELSRRVQVFSAQSLEQEARHAADCIAGWLVSGMRDIALVAVDREAARRARALLERQQILLADETGWKLSTTRAAATVDAFLQCLASDGYFRDLLDLIRSPYIAGGLDDDGHALAIRAIDEWVVDANHVEGLHALLADASRALPAGPAAGLIRALASAFAMMPTGKAPASFWTGRLLAALDALGARARLAGDLAGVQVIALLDTLVADSANVVTAFEFAEWRKWLNAEFEQALFRDDELDSPVVLTHIAATRLRHFDAAYVIGADSDHLSAASPRGILAHDGLRRELGLADAREAARQLQEDIASLVLCAGRVVFSWQAQRDGETCLPAAALQRLDRACVRSGLPSIMTPVPVQADPPAAVLPAFSAAPSLPAERVPQRISASALADLVACPYRYFARRVLRLGVRDEVEEVLGKGRVGEQVHAVLHRFHRAHPRLQDAPFDALVDDLGAAIAGSFAQAVAANFQEYAWADRLHQRAAAYVHWARTREAEGWQFEAGESDRERALTLSDGASLVLHGRIDRIDRSAGGHALIDYKLRNAKAVRASLESDEDTQLAFYTLLHDEDVVSAAYVALDEDSPIDVAHPAPVDAAVVLGGLLDDMFVALRAGAALPAHGDAAACSHCQMRGLCRKDWRS
ncbi:PD-(D/E)XK nuclease family protein [Methyloversatilis thermotolerans]|uniref:PD-(D/E)XK nuclease family protein n=1 Tax=Methyloversatilis thermotolerans TaxID=1346290 RepID=UPI0003741FD9|nr:PD-(D/E)XK nuclease family protein [Methyloversatilis thermotolerans]